MKTKVISSDAKAYISVLLCSVPTGTLCYKIYVMNSYGRCEYFDI